MWLEWMTNVLRPGVDQCTGTSDAFLIGFK